VTTAELEALLSPEDVAAAKRLAAEAPPMSQQTLATLAALLTPVADTRAA
jgi:hypothetical protein